MTWHVPQAILQSYASDPIDQARAMSIEAHLASCDLCRRRAAGLVETRRLDEMWQRIDSRISQPDRAVEKALGHWNRGDYLYRLLVVSPFLGLSWIIAVGLVLLFAIAASHSLHHTPLPFLSVAPLVPLAGVAAAYSTRFDPSYEIAVAAPISAFKLLLLRAAAVLGSTIALAVVAAPLLPGVRWAAVGWILPSLALTSATLALSTVVSPTKAAALSGSVWVALTIAVAPVARDNLVAFRPGAQGVFAMVTIAFTLLLFGRRDIFERGVPARWNIQ